MLRGVPAHDGRLKGAQHAVLRFPRRDVANLVAIDILTGSRDELSAGRFVHLQYRRDLRIGLVEDLMEEIGGALLGREPFEQQQECRRQRCGKPAVDGGRRRGVDGLGQPRTDIVDP